MTRKLYLYLGILGVASLSFGPVASAAPQTQQQRPAEQAERGTRSTTGTVADGWITMKVHAQFVGEDPLEDSDIDVDTDNGVVTLNGTVASEAGRKRAVAIAKATDGVKNVVDNLRIGRAEQAMGGESSRAGETGTAGRETGARTGKAVSDGWITSKVYSQFLTDDALDNSDIDIDVDNGAVTLNGTVSSSVARTRAAEIARKTEGVKSVQNNLKVSGGK